ncbi:hypothetical protein FRC04_004668 [Tulasnella sp. 424]|nr:hypothetical protein FRC04_004668 [Tulasnella sp. 424]KAG8960573.1 hypothetical protein FRC05_006732 [Tulasnella sp. 425]
MKRVSELLGFKRSGHRSRRQPQQALPLSLTNKVGNHAQEPSTLPSLLAGTSGSHTGQRAQNALGLYISNPSSLLNMSSPQIAFAATPSSSLLATPVTPFPKVSLPDPVPALQAELANARARIALMQQHWVPKTEIEDRVRALARATMTNTTAEQHMRSNSVMPDEEARVREKLERRIVELENQVRILQAKVRPVASFVDLRSKPQRDLPDVASTARGGPSMSSHGSMNTIDHIPATLVDVVVNHDDIVRVNNDGTAPSNPGIRRSSTAQYTFGRHWRTGSSTFGHSSAGGLSQLEIPSKGTLGRHDTRRELSSASSRAPLLAPQSQPEEQQDANRTSENTTSILPDADIREVATPTVEIEDLLHRLSVDHSAFLPPIASRPPTLIVTSNIRERRARARSSAGYSSPSVYSEHFSLAAQSRISPSPTPATNLRILDSVIAQRHGKSPAPGVETEDPRPPGPGGTYSEVEGRVPSTGFYLPAGDRSFVGYEVPPRPDISSPTKSERLTFPELKPAPRRLRSSVALIDWTPPAEPQ